MNPVAHERQDRSSAKRQKMLEIADSEIADETG
jgi:hypothetical protein